MRAEEKRGRMIYGWCYEAVEDGWEEYGGRTEVGGKGAEIVC